MTQGHAKPPRQASHGLPIGADGIAARIHGQGFGDTIALRRVKAGAAVPVILNVARWIVHQKAVTGRQCGTVRPAATGS